MNQRKRDYLIVWVAIVTIWAGCTAAGYWALLRMAAGE